MLRSSFYSFTTALSGMQISQKQLDVTGQNIANVSTVGYTRQRADVYSRGPAGYGDRYSDSSMLVGQGVKADRVSQYRDQFLDVRFRRESAKAGEEEAKLGVMNDLAMIFDEIEDGGLMESFSDFVTKLQFLVNNAESPEFDSIARDSAQTLVNQFHYYANQMQTVREEVEYNLREVTVGTLNDLMVNIANLNKSIQEVQSGGRDALELKDERNLLLDQLSNYVKLDVQYDPNYLKGGIAIEDVTISMVGADGTKHELIHNGSYSVFNVQTEGVDGTNEAIITIDNSMLLADKAVNNINNLLRGASYQNGVLQSLKNTLKSKPDMMEQLDPSGAGADFDIDKATSQELYDRITEVAKVYTDQIDAIKEQLTKNEEDTVKLKEDYKAAVEAGNADEAKYKEDLAALKKAKEELEANRLEVLQEAGDILAYQKATKEAIDNLNTYDTALEKYTEQFGVTATMMWNVGDYTTCYYQLSRKDAAGNDVPITDAAGNEIRWNVGKTTSKVDRDALEKIGIVFERSFDAEEFGSPGSLKGTLEMLNSDGIFEYDATATKGIGYYEKMLDALADQLAGVLNGLNDNVHTKDINEKLFETSDGSDRFTAENIKISDGWLNGQYGITKTQEILPGDNSGSSDNILLMISAITSRLQYKTDAIPKQDYNGNYLDSQGRIAADGIDEKGNFILTKDYTQDPPVPYDEPILVASKEYIPYKREVDAVTGEVTYTLQADILEAYQGDVYQDENGQFILDDGTGAVTIPANATKVLGTVYVNNKNEVVANGRNEYGQYTLTTTDATGKEKEIITANQDGILYALDDKDNIVVHADGKIAYEDIDNIPAQTAPMYDIVTREPSFIYNGTFQEYLGNIANVLALDISSTSNLAANHDSVLNEIQTSKDSLSSVSLDEEGVNIMQYQKAYNASARLMTALDEILDKLINSTGVAGR